MRDTSYEYFQKLPPVEAPDLNARLSYDRLLTGREIDMVYILDVLDSDDPAFGQYDVAVNVDADVQVIRRSTEGRFGSMWALHPEFWPFVEEYRDKNGLIWTVSQFRALSGHLLSRADRNEQLQRLFRIFAQLLFRVNAVREEVDGWLAFYPDVLNAQPAFAGNIVLPKLHAQDFAVPSND